MMKVPSSQPLPPRHSTAAAAQPLPALALALLPALLQPAFWWLAGAGAAWTSLWPWPLAAASLG
ncbi:hypothetical protein, partial [Teichococcus cervicalis]